MEENKKLFIELLESTQRKGIDLLIKWLEESDFFKAPASTKYHLSCEGGLLEHSLNVYKELMKSAKDYEFLKDKTDSIIITSLLHDICKANYYQKSEKNVKKENGWVKEACYIVNDEYPIGHGEKSVIIIQRFIELTEEEIMAIRWHMGAFEPKENYSMISKVFGKYPLAILLHLADLSSTYLRENGIVSKEIN